MTHPLTDEICRDLQLDNWREDWYVKEMRAAADWQLEQVIEQWEDAFRSDLEHGVRSLNDRAAKELAAKYPKIFAFGQVLAAMRPQQQQQEEI